MVKEARTSPQIGLVTHCRCASWSEWWLPFRAPQPTALPGTFLPFANRHSYAFRTTLAREAITEVIRMRTIRLRRGSWVIAAIGVFALAAALLGYGAVSAADDPPAAPASLSAVRHDGNIEVRFSHPNVANVDGWQVQTRAGNAAWGDWFDLTDVGPNAVNAYIENTDNDVHYRIRLRAVNRARRRSVRQDRGAHRQPRRRARQHQGGGPGRRHPVPGVEHQRRRSHHGL